MEHVGTLRPPGGPHTVQADGGPGVRGGPRGVGRAAGPVGGQDLADGPLVGQAAHTHVEEGAHVVKRLQEHVGDQNDGQGVPDPDGPRGQSPGGEPGGGGNEEEGEQGVGDEDDELVAGQDAHDSPTVLLPAGAQLLLGAAGRPGQGQGGQPLDGVEVLCGQAHTGASGVGGGGPQAAVGQADEQRGQDDGGPQDRCRYGVDRGPQQDQAQGGGQGGRDGGGQEGLPVQGHPLGAVGEQADRGPGALAGGVGRSQVEEVVQDAAAQGRLLSGRRAPGGGLDGGLQEGAGGGGRPGLGQQAREVGGGGGEEVAHGTPQAHQRPGLG